MKQYVEILTTPVNKGNETRFGRCCTDIRKKMLGKGHVSEKKNSDSKKNIFNKSSFYKHSEFKRGQFRVELLLLINYVITTISKT